MPKSVRKHKSEPEIEWTHAPRIEPSEYEAYCRHTKVYRDAGFQRWICALQFDVFDSLGALVVARLTHYLNLGSEEKPKARRRSKYWNTWIAANGGPPKRGDRLSPRVFERRYARVEVADTTKVATNRPTYPEECYSIVRNVLRWLGSRVESNQLRGIAKDQPNHSNHPSRQAGGKHL